MLDYSDFTVVKNNEGIPTAMGIPIQSMLLKNNIKRHYNKMKKDDRIKFDSRIFPPQLQDNTMKSRVLDFVCLLQLIIKNKRIHLSHLIYLFQYLI